VLFLVVVIFRFGFYASHEIGGGNCLQIYHLMCWAGCQPLLNSTPVWCASSSFLWLMIQLIPQSFLTGFILHGNCSVLGQPFCTFALENLKINCKTNSKLYSGMLAANLQWCTLSINMWHLNSSLHFIIWGETCRMHVTERWGLYHYWSNVFLHLSSMVHLTSLITFCQALCRHFSACTVCLHALKTNRTQHHRNYSSA